MKMRISISRNLAVMGLFLLNLYIICAPQTGAQSTPVPAEATSSFSNASLITINDISPASLYPSIITVAGVSGKVPTSPGGVKVTINNFSHTFPDDVGMVLVGPNGQALLLQDGAGGSGSEMSGVTYSFSDAGAANLPNSTAWTSGTFKPTSYYTDDPFNSPGPGTAYGNPGPAGGDTATFGSTFGGSEPNGDWKLFVMDFSSGDIGSISGGWTLEFAPPTPMQHVLDFNGDGRTDWSVVRQSSVDPNAQATWFNCFNGIAQPACYQSIAFGLASDVWVPADYDGDGKTDIAVWRSGPAGTAGFYILQSSDGILRFELFGQDGDDPTVTADYTGDGRADPAVYRNGAVQSDQSFYYYLASSGPYAGKIVFEPWGINNGPNLLGDYPAPGDYDGDGKADFMVARNDGTGHYVFWLRTNGTNNVSATGFGLSGDVNNLGDTIVPGDYDGDGKTDIAVLRGVGGSLDWYVRKSSDPNSGPLLATFGLAASDLPVQGDYDGDGKTDAAVWRPSTSDPPGSYFHVLGSTSGYAYFRWGLCQAGPPVNCDTPTANFNAH